MHKQAIKHKQAIIGGGYLFTENACCHYFILQFVKKKQLAITLCHPFETNTCTFDCSFYYLHFHFVLHLQRPLVLKKVNCLPLKAYSA